jgi:hypothetical protein
VAAEEDVAMSTPLHTRVGQLVRLLSSDQVGEAGAAALALNRAINAAGRDIYWLAEIVEAALPDAPALVPLDDDCGDWKSVARFCLSHRDALPERDAEFVASILRYRTLTPKQHAWLTDIRERIGRRRR